MKKRNKHKPFFRGIIAGISLLGFLDILLVHWILKSHRIYNHPSVEIAEPLLFVLAIIIGIIFFYKEYKND